MESTRGRRSEAEEISILRNQGNKYGHRVHISDLQVQDNSENYRGKYNKKNEKNRMWQPPERERVAGGGSSAHKMFALNCDQV